MEEMHCPTCGGTDISYCEPGVIEWSVDGIEHGMVILHHESDNMEDGHFYCNDSECLAEEWTLPDGLALEYRS